MLSCSPHTASQYMWQTFIWSCSPHYVINHAHWSFCSNKGLLCQGQRNIVRQDFAIGRPTLLVLRFLCVQTTRRNKQIWPNQLPEEVNILREGWFFVSPVDSLFEITCNTIRLMIHVPSPGTYLLVWLTTKTGQPILWASTVLAIRDGITMTEWKRHPKQVVELLKSMMRKWGDSCYKAGLQDTWSL